MKLKASLLSLFFCLSFVPSLAHGEEVISQETETRTDGQASIERFSPQGAAKGVRQVTARFSEQMVPLGDPRLMEPFEIRCPEKGRAQWADDRNWVFDFERDLPAGMVCEFSLRPDLKTLSGKSLSGQRSFSFSTGGPAIKQSYPHEGSEQIDEDQIFILTLDAEPTGESVISNVFCAVEGVREKVGVRLLRDDERKMVLKVRGYREDGTPRIVLQCRQTFPKKARVRLLWQKGVLSVSGVATSEDQALTFRARGAFIATFGCQRENPKADCIPMLPMDLRFSSPLSWYVAKKIVLRGHAQVYSPERPSHSEYDDAPDDEGEGAGAEGDGKFVRRISFKGPFPENASFTLELPGEVRDDAGRPLLNRDEFPLSVRTGPYPPLAKFSSRFGIIELKGEAVLPVTLRNLEPRVTTRLLAVDSDDGGPVREAAVGETGRSVDAESATEQGTEFVQGLKGRLHRTGIEREERIVEWLRAVATAGRKKSVLRGEAGVKQFPVPKPGGLEAFEVVGIPLKEPGFYVVEMESTILGRSLLGEQRPLYVPTAALVTNLSAHFKWGREASLVWVTTLDEAEPVKDAAVTIRDCRGKAMWKGKTDMNGIAHIRKQLPSENTLPYCELKTDEDTYYDYPQLGGLDGMSRGLFVFVRTPDDMTFVHSSWDRGIEAWRFNLPASLYQDSTIAHTVFDRTLLRAGETVHMKHLIRKQTMAGFGLVGEPALPMAVAIHHRGSGQRYDFPLTWDAKGTAETEWNIPRDAKLGQYEVVLLKKAPDTSHGRASAGVSSEGDEERLSSGGWPEGWHSGSFRVEEFRVPLMKAVIQPPQEPLVNASEVNVDLLVTYLSGGGASDAPVKLRSQVLPKTVLFRDYEDFLFGGGAVQEGISRRSSSESDEVDQDVGRERPRVQSSNLVLDRAGALRTRITGLPRLLTPQDVLTELEFRDPNGETQTVSTKIPLWPSKLLIGIKPDPWAASKESFKFHVLVLDLLGKPVPDKDVSVNLFQRKYYSHRKRLIGGFYSYEHVTEVRYSGHLCEGRSDQRGLLICEAPSPVSGNVILQAEAKDDEGNVSVGHRDVWIAGKGEWWFDVSDNDRIDLLPEKKRYEPGETAVLQVRMPFRKATALVTVEREGVMETFIRRLNGKQPLVEIPVMKNYAPNVFVSALVVRGRTAGVQPTATVDLGKPAYKLGIAEINAGWAAHELKAEVASDKKVYQIREKAQVKVKVKKADGSSPPKGSEVIIAAVDEGLLELMPNKSWQLLDAMMGRRGYGVKTSTAQMQVVGKRHYGVKAIPHGGGGGKQITRELFDTLLLWKARVPLNQEGEADFEIPLNDSLTGFRIVAVAQGGTGLFGTGQTSIRTTQDLMILSGVPPLIREGDRFRARFTIRNGSSRNMNVGVKARLKGSEDRELEAMSESLSAGEAREIGWEVAVPHGIGALNYEVAATELDGDARDILKVNQKVAEAVPIRTFQATITQIDDRFSADIEKPKDALSGKGGVSLSFRGKLSHGLDGVTAYMKRYPYTCMEQKVSRAIATRDETLWKALIGELPSYLDTSGLVKYFPAMVSGSDTLTAYLVSISHEAGWEIPRHVKELMEEGLRGFVEGKVLRYSSLPTADLSIRKIAALEALSRFGKAEASLLGSVTIEPSLWPTSAVLDWMNVLLRVHAIPDRDKRLREAEQILRSRLSFRGTTMGFSTEGSDNLWWLMVSGDVNAVRTILTLLQFTSWDKEMPRLLRGSLSRQHRGAWNITTANAWGVLAMEKFSKKFEATPVTGLTSVTLNESDPPSHPFSQGGTGGFSEQRVKVVDWQKSTEGGTLAFAWSKTREKLSITHQGAGKPWALIQSLAAVPLKEPLSSGYQIKRTLTPAEQRGQGKWSRGDIVRVRLEIEAQADMTWVVVSDPIPGGSTILGAGLARDSQLLTKQEERKGWVWPAFEERSLEAFRAYYEFVPKGKWTVEYTLRLNNEGDFNLSPTRVEALYAPEMFGELPNRKLGVQP